MITSLFTAQETWPFGVAFALIVGIALIEGLGMLVSLSPSNWLDDLLPDIDGDTGLDRVLGWLYIGKVPSLVLLVLFLTGYAIFGYSLQKVANGLLGGYLPVWIAGLVAVSEMSLIGRPGVVSAGSARRGLAAQARVRDAHGRTHYLMVEPDLDDEVFDEGAQILIVRKIGAFYRCIANPHPGLM